MKPLSRRSCADMIPPEYIDWGAGSPADRRKLIGEIYSRIVTAADHPPAERPVPVGSPAAPASLQLPVAGGGLPFKAQQQGSAQLNAAPCRTLLSCFTVAEGRRAMKIINKRG